MRISIVTPSYNQASFLEETIVSILDQGYPDLEYIVMDGGSTDGSVEIIKRYERHLAHWTSQRDAGQSDAIARGFARATGDVMNWINSDDRLAPGALTIIGEMVERAPAAGLYAAGTESFLDRATVPYHVSIPRRLELRALLGHDGVMVDRHQPGIFFRRDLYERVGGVRLDLHYGMDYELYLRMLETGAAVAYDPRIVARFRSHGESKTGGQRIRALELVQELMASAEQSATRIGLRPDHRQHLRTLCGGTVMSAQRGQWQQALGCLRLALRVGGAGGVARTFFDAARRRVERWNGAHP